MRRASLTIMACVLLSQSSTAGLVGYWPFDGDVFDVSGLENHGELMGGTFVDDVPPVLTGGQALSFEDPLDHVFIEEHSSLNSNVFTLSMFINDQEQLDGIDRFTSRESDTFETGIDKVFGTDSISYYSPSAGWVRTGTIPELETWHHLAYVADGESMTVFLDGESVFGPAGFAAAPSGFMHIGNRWNDVEGFFGIMDDVALWDVALPDSAIAELATGAKTPLEISPPDPPPPPPEPFLSVISSVDTWKLSTDSIDGGEAGDWDPSGDPLPPGPETFTLEPLPTEAGVIGHINAAADILDVEGIIADNDTHYYRTTFELDRTAGVNAELRLAIDNGAQVFINGELIATETSFLVENWGLPLPSVSFASDGTIESTKFESAAASYDGWLMGENEIVLAVRNPFVENSPAGGFAFRLDFFASGVLGDFDNNGMVDAADIDLLNREILGGQDPSFDLNQDGAVNDDDRDEMVIGVLGTWYGDSNLDGAFDSSDLVSVFSAGKYETNTEAGWAEGDWDGNLTFDSGDLVKAFSDGGYELGPRRREHCSRTGLPFATDNRAARDHPISCWEKGSGLKRVRPLNQRVAG